MKWKKGDKFIISDAVKTFWDSSDDNKTIFEVAGTGKVDFAVRWQDAAGKKCVFFYTDKYGNTNEKFFATIDCIRKPTKLELALL